GDYNGDGSVNAADYTVWRDNPAAHGGNGGYTTWAQNYGASNSPAVSVPEPASVMLVAGLLVAASIRSRKQWFVLRVVALAHHVRATTLLFLLLFETRLMIYTAKKLIRRGMGWRSVAALLTVVGCVETTQAATAAYWRHEEGVSGGVIPAGPGTVL